MPAPLETRPSSTWVPPEKRDTAWWITRKKYHCRIPSFQMTSPDYIRFFGTPDSGDPRTNAQMRNELIDVHISIGEMATYYAEGTQISIPQPRDTKDIYERIKNHLNAWKQSMANSLHPGLVPVDDLIALDKFAAALFPHAQPFFDKGFVDSVLVRKLGSAVSITMDSFLQKARDKGKTRVQIVEEQKKAQENQPKERHQSMADVFSKHKLGGPARWK